MRRVALFSIILTLVISCAAPSGAAFALEDPTIPELLQEEADSETVHTSEKPINDKKEVIESLSHVGLEESVEELIDEQTGEDVLTPYPRIVISELQVNGTCDGGSWCTGSNVEFMELHNPNNFDVSLKGWKLKRQATGATSQPTDHVVFGDIGLFAGEYAVVSLGMVEPAELIIATFSSTLNNNEGSLLLVAPDGEIIDALGWGANAKSFYTTPAEAPASNQSIQRCTEEGFLFETNPRNNMFEMLVYEDLGPTPGVGIECVEPPVINYCEGLVISEIAANHDEQFIELYNGGIEPILIGGCRVLTNRGSEAFIFPENTELGAGEYTTVPVAGSGLTLTKTTTGTVYLLSSDGVVEAVSVPYADLAENTSWAFFDDAWAQTYNVTPGTKNVFMEHLPCDEGYTRNIETGRCNKIPEPETLTDCGEGRERNPTTGRCRNIPTFRELAPCREGQYRSEETNRCRSILTGVVGILKPCADGQFRNPETNRCKKIASADDVALADCGEGRERNPETNRCRNVLGVSTESATLPFPVEETAQGAEQFTGWWVIGAIALLGTGYGIWEWRVELMGVGQRVGRFVLRRK